MKTYGIRMIATAVILTLLISMLPSAMAAGSFQAVVASSVAKVYQAKAPHSYLGTLPKGTTVTVKNYNRKAALISYNGRSGIVPVSDLMAVAGATAEVKQPETVSAVETATAAEQASAKTMVTTRATRVYKKASKSSPSVSVGAGVKISVLSVSGSVAKVQRGGVVGYMPAAHLADPDAVKPQTDTTSQATEADMTTAVVRYDNVPVVTTDAAKIYARPSTSSEYIAVDKGTKMSLIAVKGSCAMVKRDGVVGYVQKDMLVKDTSSQQSAVETAEVRTETATQESSDSGVFSGTNEQVIFRFLTRVMGYNAAAACGVMANIRYESGYKPTSGGDSGSSYGIVQWHAGRKTRLIDWCKDNGYDYTSLKGQLYYLQYELKTRYPAVHNRLKAVENSEQGAYDAGYDFCYNFEAPSNRASKSVTRGNYAKTTLWGKYKA